MARTRSKTSGADHNIMRELNRSLVVDVLKDRGPISRATIAKVADLAKPTVSGIVDLLIKEGLVREIGIGSTTVGGGRPPIMLEFNARSQFVVGVQIGVRHLELIVADALGGEVGRLQRPTPKGRPPAILKRLAELVHEALEEAQVPRKRLVAVGVCVPGLVDLDTGRCLLAPNLGWHDVEVAKLLAENIDAPIFVHNTSQAAAVAESVLGAGKGVDEIVFLYVSSGIGAGILSEGRLFHGAGGIAGEIGHCPVAGSEQRCNCGKIGCLETVASGQAIAAAAEAAVETGRRTTLRTLEGPITAKDVAEAADAGDRVAKVIIARAGHELGVAAAWLVNLLNPELLIVGGGVASAGDLLLDPLKAAVDTNVLQQSGRGVNVVQSVLGDDAEVQGAVLLALQYSETFYRVIFQG